MMTETINGIEVLMGPDEMTKAIETYLNDHIFKEPIKVTQVQKGSYYRPDNRFVEGYHITIQTTLQRLAGEGDNK